MNDKIYEDDPLLDFLYKMNEYADTYATQNWEFLDSCMKMLKRNGYLSKNQVVALLNIHEKIDYDLHKE